MKALDTNIIVRLLTHDDKKRASLARAVLEQAQAAGESLFVTDFVVLELMWALESAYEYSRQDILDHVDLLSRCPFWPSNRPI